MDGKGGTCVVLVGVLMDVMIRMMIGWQRNGLVGVRVCMWPSKKGLRLELRGHQGRRMGITAVFKSCLIL